MPDHQPEADNARQRSKFETRRRLLAAAAQTFAKYGGEKTTINMVARGAGVATGTVYLHFRDKEGLLEAVLTEALGELKRALTEIAAREPARSAEQDVRQRTDGVVAFARRHRDLATVLFDPGNLGSAVGRDVLAYLTASQAAGLAAGQEKGWYRRDLPAVLVAPALVGSLVLLMDEWLRQGLPGEEGQGPQDVARLLAELRLRGVGA